MELHRLFDAGKPIEDLLDDRLFLWEILDSLFLIPKLLSSVFVYTVIKGFGLKVCISLLLGVCF